MAFGCYFTAIMTIPPAQKGVLLPDVPGILGGHMGTIPALLVAAGLAGVLGYVLAIPLMRLSGLPAGIATLAILVIAKVVMDHWDAVTRGNQTFIGAPVDTNRTNAFIWAAIAIVLVYLFQRSRFGFRLQASREDELAAAGVGIGVHAHRRLSFALSAAIVAVAGGLYGHLIGVFSPDSFYVDVTFLLIVMLVLGGIKSLAGAVVGTVAVMIIQEILQRFERGFTVASLDITIPAGVDALVLAAILGLVIVLRPDGITRGREFTLPRALSGRGPRIPKPDDTQAD
jgi:branched-chain amino acid transport system permease protein